MVNPTGGEKPSVGRAAAPPPGAGGERRKHRRFALQGAGNAEYIPGVLSVFGWGERNRARGVLDLSEGGARLVTEKPLTPGSVLRLEIRVPRHGEQIQAYGETRWSRPASAQGSEYLAGVMFLDLEDAQRAKISRLRQRLSC